MLDPRTDPEIDFSLCAAQVRAFDDAAVLQFESVG